MSEKKQEIQAIIDLFNQAKANPAGRTHVDAIARAVQETQAFIPGRVDTVIRMLLAPDSDQLKLQKSGAELARYILAKSENNPRLVSVATEIIRQIAQYDGPPAPPAQKRRRSIHSTQHLTQQ